MTIVSIIIPVCQVSDYIERCVRSVMKQTYRDIECVLVDDCSPDDSMAKAENLMNQYCGAIKFVTVHHDKNRGLSAARNTGFQHSTGDYIYFLDSDDEITPNCIESLMRVAQEDPSLEMLQGYSSCPLVDPFSSERERLAKELLPLSFRSNAEIRRCYYTKSELIRTSAWDKLVKRTFITEHNLLFRDGVHFEDTLWLFYVLKYLNGIYLVSDLTHYYHVRPNSLVTGMSEVDKASSSMALYCDVLTHLSGGWERKEMAFYADGFCRRYVECVRFAPAYQDVFSLYWEKAWHYGCMTVLLKLVLARSLGCLKHGPEVLAWIKTKS